MQASFALEGMLPDEADLVLETNYVLGQVNLSDMLDHGRAYAQGVLVGHISRQYRKSNEKLPLKPSGTCSCNPKIQ